MPWTPSTIAAEFRFWFRDYDSVQSFAVLLLYLQIGCALIGSLGAWYNGVLLVHLVVSLYALVAIESCSQTLGRTYAVLLACSIVLDVAWFILFSPTLWKASSEKFDKLFVFSLKLTLWMQIVGISFRSLSAILWIQMYRLGVQSMDSSGFRTTDYDIRNSFISPRVPETVRQNSASNDVLGGSIYDLAYYSSLFEGTEDQGLHPEGEKEVREGAESNFRVESPRLRSCISKSFQVVNTDSEPSVH